MLTEKVLKGVLQDKLDVSVNHVQEKEFEIDLNAMIQNHNYRLTNTQNWRDQLLEERKYISKAYDYFNPVGEEGASSFNAKAMEAKMLKFTIKTA
ncbi:hypothetical protein ABVC46_02310 [Lactobacillus crispatus]|jgi:hypothetical protein|uniref:Uncharacterized protein n=1 Tax=Lactobacillus crispatus TaxID=47770 RepID=A0AAW8WSD6_9LACO|nr:hypothetical protein [Lactobacillus crispatus]STX18467.1 Uncharacterised protein [Lactobacillus acidophilus]MCT7696394.1 hypothetical protein [Lactobacillus crispatus]MCT7707854.1 hypothetical protein [Lactobacillus crispatus]MCT7731344.1 hypothetical protein [Lactobacillus crispatus]MCT7802738.1 hypothetical protein [Lactobacillus crispatus]